MPHFISVFTVCKSKKKSSDKRIQYFLKIITGHPLIMYNGLSLVYCVKPDGIIHKYTKGFQFSSIIVNLHLQKANAVYSILVRNEIKTYVY